MVMEASVGEDYHRNCVLLLDQKLSTTEMIQMDSLVVVECSGEYSCLMLHHGLWGLRYVIVGMQMETVASVVGELQLQCVLLLENLFRDDTNQDGRGGGCRMSWRLSIPTNSPQWLKNVKLCFEWYADGNSGQCGGSVGQSLCATANSWTTYYWDDMDGQVEDVAWPGACTSNFTEIYFVIDTLIVLAHSLAS